MGPCILKGHAHTNQLKRYAVIIATHVSGPLIFMKAFALTSYPALCSIPSVVIFADAPIGVMLPPRVAPDSSPKYSRYGSMPIDFDTIVTTGSIVATYGMLSINA